MKDAFSASQPEEQSSLVTENPVDCFEQAQFSIGDTVRVSKKRWNLYPKVPASLLRGLWLALEEEGCITEDRDGIARQWVTVHCIPLDPFGTSLPGYGHSFDPQHLYAAEIQFPRPQETSRTGNSIVEEFAD
jgi:hypothetical protein